MGSIALNLKSLRNKVQCSCSRPFQHYSKRVRLFLMDKECFALCFVTAVRHICGRGITWSSVLSLSHLRVRSSQLRIQIFSLSDLLPDCQSSKQGNFESSILRLKILTAFQ